MCKASNTLLHQCSYFPEMFCPDALIHPFCALQTSSLPFDILPIVTSELLEGPCIREYSRRAYALLPDTCCRFIWGSSPQKNTLHGLTTEQRSTKVPRNPVGSSRLISTSRTIQRNLTSCCASHKMTLCWPSPQKCKASSGIAWHQVSTQKAH